MILLILENLGRLLMEFAQREREKRDPAPRPIVDSVKELWGR